MSRKIRDKFHNIKKNKINNNGKDNNIIKKYNDIIKNESIGNIIGKIIFIILSIIFTILITIVIIFFTSKINYKNLLVDGKANVSEWQNNESKLVSLKGNWEFYWNNFVTEADIQNGAQPDLLVKAPDVWNNYEIDGKKLPGFGYASYKISITGIEVGREISFYIPTMSTAYEMYIDDNLVSSCGEVSKTEAGSKPEYRPKQVNYTPTADHFDIIVHVSNYSYARGGMWYCLYMGTASNISNIRELIVCRDMFILGSFFVMIFLFLSIYLSRKKERASLFLALISFTAVCRTLVYGGFLINYLFPHISFDVIVKMDYMTLYWFPIIMQLVLYEIFQDHIKFSMIKVFIYIDVALSIFTIVAPISVLTNITKLAELMMVVISLSIYSQLYDVLKLRKKYAIVMYIGFTVDLAAGVYDVLLQASMVEFVVSEFTPLGLFFMIMLQAYVLARNFTASIEYNEKSFIEIKNHIENERKSELKFLKSQIKPHFVNNALNTIISVSRTDIYKAQELLVEFSTYLRGCFDFKDIQDLIPLEREIEFIKAYVVLQQARFGDKIQVTYEMDDMSFMLPSLILQPLVENAITHGIREKKTMGNILIYEISHTNFVRIGVKDDGIGIDKERIEKLINGIEQSRGIGVYNITSRLQKTYGISLQIENIKEGGVDVYMDIPQKIRK